MKYCCIGWLLLMTIAGGCDDGRIYSEDGLVNREGRTVKLRGEVVSPGDYGEGYSLVLAAFEEGSDYAVVSKGVSQGEEAVLTNVDVEEGTAELCLINAIRKRVMTLEEIKITSSSPDELVLDVGRVDAKLFSIINKKIFSGHCLQCHGATGNAAARLSLKAEEAYAMLVDVPSEVAVDKMRVRPFSSSLSTLWTAVGTTESSDWKFNHSNLLTPGESGLVYNWIEMGAKNE